MVKTYGTDRIDRNLALLDKMRSEGHPPSAPAGWIVTACRDNYAGDRSPDGATSPDGGLMLDEVLHQLAKRGIQLSQSNPLDRYVDRVGEKDGKALFRLLPEASQSAPKPH